MGATSKGEKNSSATTPASSANALAASLIQNPSSELEHCQNLALLAVHQDVTLEILYRQLCPHLKHAQVVRLLNLPEFLNALEQMVNAETALAYPRIMKALTQRALQGDVSAVKEVRTVLGIAKQGERDVSLMDELMSRLATVDRQTKTIEVKAEVK